MKHTITAILILTGLNVPAQTLKHYKKKIEQYNKHRVVFDDKEFEEILKKSNLINFENCIGNLTNEQMSNKTDSLNKAFNYDFTKKRSKVDLYNYEALRWRNSEKCIKYKLANNIPFKEYKEPEDLYSKEQRLRIKEHQVVFENKKLEKYAYAYHDLKIKATKNYWNGNNYNREFKRVNRKIEQIKSMSPSDGHNFDMLMSKASLVRYDLIIEQSKKSQIIKKQIRQLYAKNLKKPNNFRN